MSKCKNKKLKQSIEVIFMKPRQRRKLIETGKVTLLPAWKTMGNGKSVEVKP